MKTAGIVLALLASATSFVLPDVNVFEELAVTNNVKNHAEVDDASTQWSQAWRDGVSSASHALTSAEDFIGDSLDKTLGAVNHASEDLSRGFDNLGDDFNSLADDYFPDFADEEEHEDDGGDHGGRHGRRPHRPGHGGRDGRLRGVPSKTIYEQIKASNYTKKFAKLVDEYDDIAALLKDTKTNHTLFVPTDMAFERIPGHGRRGRHGGTDDGEQDDEELILFKDDQDCEHKKPSREFILSVLQYHVIPGFYPAGRVLASHTLPTSLRLHDLGDRPQRLRVSLGLGGVRVNIYARVVAVNFVAKNGVIHAVDHVLVPPPRAGALIKLLPGQLSTLTLGLQNTGLDVALAELARTTRGGTIFAPTNGAFARLPLRVNAFLFSERGKPYLTALLKYHVVVNETLYSDAYYAAPNSNDETAFSGGPMQRYHVDLPSLLEGKSISVDIRRWRGFIGMRVNGYVRVAFQDGIAEDGVIQVVSSVLFPPHRRGGRQVDVENMTIEDLVERLQDYVVDPVENTETQVVMGDL